MDKKTRYRYFFVDNKLHKLLKINRGADTCEAWCFQEEKRYLYPWSHIQRSAGRAWTARNIASFMNRESPISVWQWVDKGLLSRPETTKMIGGDSKPFQGGRHTSFWRTDQVEDMLESMSVLPHYKNIPNKRELRAYDKYGIKLYAKNEDGEFVPVWEAENWWMK